MHAPISNWLIVTDDASSMIAREAYSGASGGLRLLGMPGPCDAGLDSASADRFSVASGQRHDVASGRAVHPGGLRVLSDKFRPGHSPRGPRLRRRISMAVQQHFRPRQSQVGRESWRRHIVACAIGEQRELVAHTSVSPGRPRRQSARQEHAKGPLTVSSGGSRLAKETAHSAAP